MVTPDVPKTARATVCASCGCGVALSIGKTGVQGTHALAAGSGQVSLTARGVRSSDEELTNSLDDGNGELGPTVSVVRGYTVRVRPKRISRDEACERRKILAAVMARAMRR